MKDSPADQADRRDVLGFGPKRFPTTRWSMVLAAGDRGADRSERALARLCADYWRPLYEYTRRRGYDPEDARDLTQAFFLKLLEKRDLRAADPARGRFRTFLLTALKNFLTGEWRKDVALKRGGGAELLSLDFDSAEASYRLETAHHLSPDAIYQRRWALTLIERTWSDLRESYAESGESDLFEALKGIVEGQSDALPYADLSRRLGRGEGALRTAASRLRKRWRERLRALVAETVLDTSDVRDEMESLIGSLSL